MPKEATDSNRSTQLTVGLIATFGVIAAAAISNSDKIFPSEKANPSLRYPFYVTNEIGFSWARKFSLRGTYVFDRSSNSLRVQISEGSIRTLEDGYITRLTVSICYPYGEAFDIFPHRENEQPNQHIHVGSLVREGEIYRIGPREIVIRGIDTTVRNQRPWLCGQLWGEQSFDGEIQESSVPGHELNQTEIDFTPA